MAEAVDFLRDRLAIPETMTAWVELLGGPGKGKGTSKAADRLGVDIREVQRVLKGERVERETGQTIRELRQEYSPKELQAKYGQLREFSPANREKMDELIRKENQAQGRIDISEAQQQGVTVTGYRGRFDYDASADEPTGNDVRKGRSIGAPIHISGEALRGVMDAYQQGQDELASERFDAAYFKAYAGLEAARMWDVQQLRLRLGE